MCSRPKYSSLSHDPYVHYIRIRRRIDAEPVNLAWSVLFIYRKE